MGKMPGRERGGSSKEEGSLPLPHRLQGQLTLALWQTHSPIVRRHIVHLQRVARQTDHIACERAAGAHTQRSDRIRHAGLGTRARVIVRHPRARAATGWGMPVALEARHISTAPSPSLAAAASGLLCT